MCPGPNFVITGIYDTSSYLSDHSFCYSYGLKLNCECMTSLAFTPTIEVLHTPGQPT